MQQTQDSDTTSSKSEQAYTTPLKPGSRASRDKNLDERLAVDEAKRLLSEIAGVEPSPPTRPDSVKAVKSVLLFPLILLKLLLVWLLSLFSKLDLSLLHDMRRFLAHPGHFFWFNRLAPDRAAKHFRTTSTDAMTHHVRRYGAHLAMLVLAAVVVFGGGFGKFIKPILDGNMAKAMGPEGSGMLVTDGDMHLLYISTLGDPSANLPHRIQIYEVKEGDTLAQIAQDNNISIDTLLYANLLVDPDADLAPGLKLVVPPVTGMLHIVNYGDTIDKIAARYQVDPQVILSYPQNNLQGTDSTATQLKSGLEVIVPGGILPSRTVDFLYTVRADDTLQNVAEKFGITPETILYNNKVPGKALKPGEQITILPLSGIEYSVKPGDTLQNLASRYSVSPDSIRNYPGNNLVSDKLELNSTLYLPDAVPPVEVPIITPLGPVTIKVAQPAPKKVVVSGSSSNSGSKSSGSSSVVKSSGSSTTTTGSAVNKPAIKPAVTTVAAAAKPAPTKAPVAPVAAPKAAPKAAPAVNKAPVAPAPVKQAAAPAIVKQAAPAPARQAATGSLVWPIYGTITTYFHQYLWYGIHQGLDISTARGTPTVAADAGLVIEAAWNPYGYGISVLIDHGNGMQTRYGHFDGLAVSRGQYVRRGQVIGYEGNTGNSSGPHLHFEVHVNGVIVNPLNYLR